MRVVSTRAEVREAVAIARARGARIAFVPTMGYLHEGHLTLLDRARELADYLVLSIFVNPLQFGEGEDLERYPRDPIHDRDLAEGRGVDLLFTPEPTEIYPSGEPGVQVVPIRGADLLCGAHRPGHFQGVLTVVMKLFQIVAPDLAIFGQKDLQQAALIRGMVADLDLPIEIEVAPIVREEDGLALSSRNLYLSADEREQALSLYRGLREASSAFDDGEVDSAVLRGLVGAALAAAGARVDYIEVVDPATLERVERASPGVAIAVAATVGQTRLIDNLILR